MSTTATRTKDATTDARVGKVDMKLEVVAIPVSDVDRAKEFYGSLGWRLDADFSPGGAAWSSSRLPAPSARSTSARTSPPPRPDPPRACS